MSDDDMFDAEGGSVPPPGGADDLSMFDNDEPVPGYVMGSDDETLKQITKRTSTAGRIATVLILIAIPVLGYWGYQSTVAYETRMDRLEEINQMEDEAAIVPALRELLAQASHDDVRQRVIKNLGFFRDRDSVPAFIQALDTPGPVRRDAAWALGRIGLPDAAPAKDKLLEVLPDCDARDKAQVLWTLAVLREDRAAEAIVEGFSQGMFSGMDDFDPAVITQVLGPARLGSDDLLNHAEVSVRVLTAHALAEAASPEVVDPLGRLIHFELQRPDDAQESEVIRAAAAGLGRTNDARAAEPLFALLQQKPNFRPAVIDALKRSTAAPGLIILMNAASDISVKRDLVRLVAESHDTRAADALASLLGSEDADIQQTAAFALADLGDRRAGPTLVQIARGEDEAASDEALRGIKKISNPELSASLVELLEALPYSKAAILRAMGLSGDQGLADEIEAELEGDDQRAASLALADLGNDGAFRTLMDRMKRPRDVEMGATNAAERSLPNEQLLSDRKAAIQAIGQYGRSAAVEALMTIVEDGDDDYELRFLAAAAIGMCADDAQLAAVIEKIRDTSVDEAARRYYVQALWQKPHPEMNAQLLELIANAEIEPEVRRSAALAVGYSGDASVDARLMDMLESEATRRDAAFAISLGGSEEAARKLLTVLQHDNDVREILQDRIMNNENDHFNLLTTDMFESGQIWRRLRVARLLRIGNQRMTFTYAWAKATAVMQSGWEGANGVDRRYIREQLWAALMGDDDERRAIAAELLNDQNELGLLLRARDEGGPGGDAARAILLASRPDAT